MCRRNHVFGCSLMAFGVGLLVGLCLESGFFFSLVSLGLIALGFWCLGRR